MTENKKENKSMKSIANESFVESKGTEKKKHKKKGRIDGKTSEIRQ